MPRTDTTVLLSELEKSAFAGDLAAKMVLEHPITNMLLKELVENPLPAYIRLEANFSKDNVFKDGKRRLIAGYASVEVIDKQNELITIPALQNAWMKMVSAGEKYANINLEHSNITLGKILLTEHIKDSQGREHYSHVDDRGLYVLCELRDDLEIANKVWEMACKGELNAFSIGGRCLKRRPVSKSSIGPYWQIDDIELYEVTICKRGKNTLSGFEVLKSYRDSGLIDEATFLQKSAEIQKSEQLVKALSILPNIIGKTFILRENFVCQADIAKADGHTVDLLVKMDQENPLRRHIQTQFSKAIPAESWPDLGYIFGGEDAGSKPLFHLALVPVEPAGVTKGMSALPIDLTKIGPDLCKQILRAALVAETDAISLYEQLAASAVNEDVKKLLLDVAKEEKTHAGEFQAKLMALDPEGAQEAAAGAKEVAALTSPADTQKGICECCNGTGHIPDPPKTERGISTGVDAGDEDYKSTQAGVDGAITLESKCLSCAKVDEDAKKGWGDASFPDDSFAWVPESARGPNGVKGDRKLPYKTQSGGVDLPHVRNALARLSQTDGIPDSEKAKIRSMLQRILQTDNKGLDAADPNAAARPLPSTEQSSVTVENNVDRTLKNIDDRKADSEGHSMSELKKTIGSQEIVGLGTGPSEGAVTGTATTGPAIASRKTRVQKMEEALKAANLPVPPEDEKEAAATAVPPVEAAAKEAAFPPVPPAKPEEQKAAACPEPDADDKEAAIAPEALKSLMALDAQGLLPPAMHKMVEAALTKANITKSDLRLDKLEKSMDTLTKLVTESLTLQKSATTHTPTAAEVAAELKNMSGPAIRKSAYTPGLGPEETPANTTPAGAVAAPTTLQAIHNMPFSAVHDLNDRRTQMARGVQ